MTIKPPPPIELVLSYSVQLNNTSSFEPRPQPVLFGRLGLYEGRGLELKLQ